VPESVRCPFCARPILVTPEGKIPRHATEPNGPQCLPPYPYPHPHVPPLEAQRTLWDADTERRHLKGRLLAVERQVELLQRELNRTRTNLLRSYSKSFKMKDTTEGTLTILRENELVHSEFPDVWY
jgi:hypothetical protein